METPHSLPWVRVSEPLLSSQRPHCREQCGPPPGGATLPHPAGLPKEWQSPSHTLCPRLLGSLTDPGEGQGWPKVTEGPGL